MLTVLLLCTFLACCQNAFAVETSVHTVEKGETFSEIAWHNNLTTDQLSLANPEIDTESLLVGDTLIIPPSNVTEFQKFMDDLYGQYVTIDLLTCYSTAIHSFNCYISANNISVKVITNLKTKLSYSAGDGTEKTINMGSPLAQIMPGENIPFYFEIPNDSPNIESIKIRVQSLKIIPNSAGIKRLTDTLCSVEKEISPDGLRSSVIVRCENDSTESSTAQINILAAAYSTTGDIMGTRSIYVPFQNEISFDIYSAAEKIESVQLWIEFL